MNEIVSFKNAEEIREKFGGELKKALTAKRLLFGAGATVGLLVVGALVVKALIIGISIMALGLLGFGLAVTGLVAWKKLPRWLLDIEHREVELKQVAMNRHLAAQKAEARANPIEQLQNYLIEKQRRLVAFKGAVSDIGAQVKTMADMLSDRKVAKPGKDYSKKEQSLLAMNGAYDKLRSTAEKGDRAIADLREVIDDQKFDWKFAQVGASAMQNLRAMNGEDLLNEMLAGESFDEVRTNFNRVFADIEIEIGNINSGKALTFGEGNDGLTIDISAIRIDQQPELVPVQMPTQLKTAAR